MDERARRTRRALDAAAVVAFAALVTAPTVDRVARPSSARDTLPENRAPAPAPRRPHDVAEARLWPERFDRWFADTLGLRDALLAARNGALVDAGVSPTATLDVGAGGWVFFRGDGAFESHRGTSPTLHDEVERWVAALEERRARLAERGVRFLFAPVPDKESIYADRLPAAWAQVGPTRLDLLFLALAARTQVDFVDLRPALRTARGADHAAIEDHVYFPRGTHWTHRGACAANVALVTALARSFPGLVAPDRGTGARVRTEGDDTWMRSLYLPERVGRSWSIAPRGGPEGGTGLVPVRAGATTLGGSGREGGVSVHLDHDSHGPFLHPFLSASVRRLRASWATTFDESIVDAERPDVVVMLRAERLLSRAPDAYRSSVLGPSRALEPEQAVFALGADRACVEVVGAGAFAADEHGVTWTAGAWDDRFVISLAGRVRDAGRVVVVADVEGPGAGNLDLAPGGERGPTEFAGARNVPVRLAAGRNRETVVVGDVVADGRLLVRIGPPGTWRFRRLEIHALPLGPLCAPRAR